MTKPNSTAALVDEWLERQTDSTPFTYTDLANDIMENVRPSEKNSYPKIKNRVSVKLSSLLKQGKVQKAGKTKPRDGGCKQTAWVKVFAVPTEATLTPEDPELPLEPQVDETPTPPAPDTVTDWQMGRGIYNYIQHLESCIVAEQDAVRKTQEQGKLRAAHLQTEIAGLKHRVEELEQEKTVLQQKLDRATTVRVRRQPIERTMNIRKMAAHLNKP